MGDSYGAMRQKRQEGTPSMRTGSNLLVDPALVQQLILAACAYEPEVEHHRCPDCEAIAENPKLIDHGEACPIGDLSRRAHLKLKDETG